MTPAPGPSPGIFRAGLGCAALLLGLLAGCGGSGGSGAPAPPPPPPPPAPAPVAPTPNASRSVVATVLTADVSARAGQAVITLAPSMAHGATLEAGDLVLTDVQANGAALPWARRGNLLDLGLPASDAESTVTVRYQFQWHEQFDGASANGYSFTWPAFCGNLFPCQSQPARGQRFTLQVQGVPAQQRVIQGAGMLAGAPAYQLAWTIGNYVDLSLGQTQAGTRLVASHLPGQAAAMQQGSAYLLPAFQWMEATLGPYRFGTEAGPVSVAWPPSAYGGMEHHPRWHIAPAALNDPVLQVHEAAHGWFGNGVRLACWEDFVLSEGTASYLAARALDVTAPAAGASAWTTYAAQLAGLSGQEPVWPAGCSQPDAVRAGLYTQAPYVRGALFYRALALKLGPAAVDRALARFYTRYAGQAAGMQDMLDTLQAETGYNPAQCAQTWLRSSTRPALAPCP